MVPKRILAVMLILFGILLGVVPLFRFLNLWNSKVVGVSPDDGFITKTMALNSEKEDLKNQIRQLEARFLRTGDSGLSLAEDTVVLMDRWNLDVDSYSIIEIDDAQGLEVRFQSSAEDMLSFFRDLEQLDYLVDIQSVSIVAESDLLVASMRIAVADSDTDEDQSDSEGITALAMGGIADPATVTVLFGRPVVATNSTLDEIPQMIVDDPEEFPASNWINLVGEYVGSDGTRVLALMDQRNGRIHSLRMGQNDGEWELIRIKEQTAYLVIGEKTYLVEAEPE